MNNIEQELYKLSLKAYKKNEVPVAALITCNNKIISKAYNSRKSTSNPLNHAEIKAILKATKRLKDWRLDDCDLYVTLIPCHMCLEIIKEVRIKNVYYYCDNLKNINLKTNLIKIDNLYSIKNSELLTNFFKKIR